MMPNSLKRPLYGLSDDPYRGLSCYICYICGRCLFLDLNQLGIDAAKELVGEFLVAAHVV